MSLVVLDTDVLSSASPGQHERAKKGWELLQCLVEKCHFLLASPNLWAEYKQIPGQLLGRKKLSKYVFSKVEMDSEPQDVGARQRLEQLGVDSKDVEWVILAAKHEAVFVTWEKYAPRRGGERTREQRHQSVVREVEEEFGVCIWHPDYAMRRLCG